MNARSGAEQTATNRYTVPSVRTAVSILKLLKRKEHRKSSLAEICRALDVSKSSAFTVLKTLQDADFVSYDSAEKRYSLGLALLELGGVVADEMDDVSVSRPFVRELAATTQETCILVRWMNTQFIVLHCEQPLREVRVAVAVGQHFHMIAGALGKAYFAFASPERVKQVIRDISLRPYTPHSITDMQHFESELAKCRQLGYAESVEESILGINALAAPIFDKQGNVALVIATLGFGSSLSPELMRRDGALVREAAWKITAALGGTIRPGQFADAGEAGGNAFAATAEH